MSLAVAGAIIVTFDVALLALLAYVMSLPRNLSPHAHAQQPRLQIARHEEPRRRAYAREPQQRGRASHSAGRRALTSPAR